MSKKNKLKFMNAIADALTAAGFEVEQPRADCDYLDVWGYESLPGRKRRRKCFEEINGFIYEHNGHMCSYWSTNQTYDAEDDDIEVLESRNDSLTGIGSLIAHLSVQPLKRKAA
jgi:hypothetical protein